MKVGHPRLSCAPQSFQSSGLRHATRTTPRRPRCRRMSRRFAPSLDPYTSFTLAKNAGYSTAITDCMSNGDEGAMGVHFGNTALIDGTADPHASRSADLRAGERTDR